jgi:hypothetical protein
MLRPALSGWHLAIKRLDGGSDKSIDFYLCAKIPLQMLVLEEHGRIRMIVAIVATGRLSSS